MERGARPQCEPPHRTLCRSSSCPICKRRRLAKQASPYECSPLSSPPAASPNAISPAKDYRTARASPPVRTFGAGAGTWRGVLTRNVSLPTELFADCRHAQYVKLSQVS